MHFRWLMLCVLGFLPASAQVMQLNERQEAEVGKLASAQLEIEQPLFPDAKANAYVQRVGLRLVRESARPGLRYTFKILQSDDVNAYALPGGYVYVTRGLLEFVADEGELAGVLAHEIGHIAARQHASKIRRSQLASLGVGFLGPVVGGGVRAAAAVRGGRSGVRGLFLRFNKNDEREADRMAAKNLYDAEYDPDSLLRFLKRLRAQEEDEPGLVKRYFSSHATLDERTDTLEDLIVSFPPKSEWRSGTQELKQIQAHVAAVKPKGAVTSSEAAAAVLEAGEDEPDSPQARDREVASLFAPIFYQGMGDQPRYDYITNFDFDGDWRGDNNWANAANKDFPLRAWIYYSVRETRTHYFLHYAVFHPRDYKGGAKTGRLLGKVIRTATKPALAVDPTGRAHEAALAHENDLEGCLVVVEKRGADPKKGKVVFVETLAHNRFLKYVPAEEPKEGFEPFEARGRRVKLFIEPKGHGIEAYNGQDTNKKVTARLYTFTGHADEPEDHSTEAIGYNLAPLETTLWPEAQRGVTPAFAETEEFGTILIDMEENGTVREHEWKLGRLGLAFRGTVGGANLARPPWGWFDAKDRDQPLGQWFFDPARTVRRDFGLPETFPVVYLRLWPTPVL